MLRCVLALILLLPMSAAMADITGKPRIIGADVKQLRVSCFELQCPDIYEQFKAVADPLTTKIELKGHVIQVQITLVSSPRNHCYLQPLVFGRGAVVRQGKHSR